MCTVAIASSLAEVTEYMSRGMSYLKWARHCNATLAVGAIVFVAAMNSRIRTETEAIRRMLRGLADDDDDERAAEQTGIS